MIVTWICRNWNSHSSKTIHGLYLWSQWCSSVWFLSPACCIKFQPLKRPERKGEIPIWHKLRMAVELFIWVITSVLCVGSWFSSEMPRQVLANIHLHIDRGDETTLFDSSCRESEKTILKRTNTICVMWSEWNVILNEWGMHLKDDNSETDCVFYPQCITQNGGMLEDSSRSRFYGG